MINRSPRYQRYHSQDEEGPGRHLTYDEMLSHGFKYGEPWQRQRHELQRAFDEGRVEYFPESSNSVTDSRESEYSSASSSGRGSRCSSPTSSQSSGRHEHIYFPQRYGTHDGTTSMVVARYPEEHEGYHPDDEYYRDDDGVRSSISSCDEYATGDYADGHWDGQCYEGEHNDGEHTSDSQGNIDRDYEAYYEEDGVYSDGCYSDDGYDSEGDWYSDSD